MEPLILIILILPTVTLAYKLSAFRDVGDKRPLIAFFPKYRMQVDHDMTTEGLENMLSQFGFKKKWQRGAMIHFSRGSVLGDFSINLAKINLTLRELAPDRAEIAVQAGWVALFDTGDHWQFITELASKLRSG